MADPANVPNEAGDPQQSLNFKPSDLEHLKAAQGWIQLGAWDVANDELENITPQREYQRAQVGANGP